LKEQNQLRIFNELNDLYQAAEPFHIHIKSYYRKNKNIGSNDRRLLSSLSYDLFRLGRALPHLPREERMVISSFLCEKSLTNFLSFWFKKYPHFEALNEIDMQQSVASKIDFIKSHYPDFNEDDIFPFSLQLSEGISRQEMSRSMFVQPLLWIRVKPEQKQKVNAWLEKNNIQSKQVQHVPDAIGLPPRTSLADMENDLGIKLQVQDLTSQMSGKYFSTSEGESWWDCCAASGGKSLLLKSRNIPVNLFVSDVRPAILANLHTRFQSDGIKEYNHAVTDLIQKKDPIVFQNHPTRNKVDVGREFFDNILVDAPCSGSGTWARTPEMLNSFDENSVASYQQRQLQIVENVIPFLKKGGKLYYITCSVFKAENEGVVNSIIENTGMRLLEMELIAGFRERADNLFTAVLQKV
jgi:16S rRNA (cytosine967-C5)-methyltransferase